MSKLKWFLIIVLLLIVGVVIWSKDAIMAAWAKLTAGPNAPSPPATTKFPVCINSSDADIRAAFIASGMLDAFKVAWQSGSYDGAYTTWAQLETQIMSDPHGWLTGHPYLYAAYPEYFIVP